MEMGVLLGKLLDFIPGMYSTIMMTSPFYKT